jgi:Ni/Co efflux regulator RcnB
MKRLVSFLLGAALLFGAATLGLQSGSANARDRQDKPATTIKQQEKNKVMRTSKTRHHRHRKHRRHRRHHKLSY